MQNQLITMLMNQMKSRNPQTYQFIQQAMNNKNDPMQLLTQITSNYSNEQMTNLMEKAKQIGIPNEVLSKVQ